MSLLRGRNILTDTWNLRAIIALGVATIVILFGIPEGRAQTQNPLLPRLSRAGAQFFQNAPAARDQFLMRPPLRPPGPPQATRSTVRAPLSGGTWQGSTPGPTVGLCNPLLLTDGTV